MFRPDQLANYSTKHKGHCYKNSNLASASAEEHQARIAASDLLLNTNGTYAGDDKAIFAQECNADNDTRSPKNFIRTQNQIFGKAADKKACFVSDWGHLAKNNNNSLFEFVKRNPSFRGKNLLSPLRIKAINTDCMKIVKDYWANGYEEESRRQEAIQQIVAIPRHHSGKHNKCKHKKWCKYIEVHEEHPDWKPSQIKEEAAKRSRRAFGGRDMDLGESGIKKVTKVLLKRFNIRSIDGIAKQGCSNLSKHFFRGNVKFTEGKRINQDHTDLWIVANRLTFC